MSDIGGIRESVRRRSTAELHQPMGGDRVHLLLQTPVGGLMPCHDACR